MSETKTGPAGLTTQQRLGRIERAVAELTAELMIPGGQLFGPRERQRVARLVPAAEQILSEYEQSPLERRASEVTA